MRIAEMSWGQVEAYLRSDDRCAVPLGSVEQHANLSLAVDAILSERVATEAAEPLGVPVFPAVAYGITPYFLAYPGSVSLRVSTYVALVRDVLDSLRRAGFRRVLLVNGHGGNQPAGSLAIEYMADHGEMQIRFHNWWNAPKTFAKVQEIDKVASHASWMENFPWTRLPDVKMPDMQRPMVDIARVRVLDPVALRQYLGDGNFGGMYQRPDDELLALWEIAVDETRALLTGSWGAEVRS
jgi:creatinine amidohydrolase